LVLEALVDVTVAFEVGSWDAEFARVRGVRCKALGQDRVTREEPGLDSVAVPLHHVVSTLVVVEAFAEGVGADFVDVAAGWAVRVDRAVGEDLGVALTETVDLALGVGMQDVLIDFVVIDTFDDVDLFGVSVPL
jgi:hypothetical protein